MMFGATPEELEAAAIRAYAQAAELRRFDELEPQGDEPTISWDWVPNDQPGGPATNYDRKAYTFVAFKADNGHWYKTGGCRDTRSHRGYTWRELGVMPECEALRNGDFLVVAEWEHRSVGK